MPQRTLGNGLRKRAFARKSIKKEGGGGGWVGGDKRAHRFFILHQIQPDWTSAAGVD